MVDDKAGLGMAIDTNIMTPFVEANGFGTIDEARMARAIEQLAAALDLPSQPAVADVWTADFLPDQAMRQLAN